MTANYHVDCQRKTLRIDLVQISPRDGALRRGADVADHAPANVTEQLIMTFSCDKGQKSSAQCARERGFAGGHTQRHCQHLQDRRTQRYW